MLKIYSSHFFASFAKDMLVELNGITNLQSIKDEDQNFQLSNSQLEDLASNFEDNKLGDRKNAYTRVYSALRP